MKKLLHVGFIFLVLFASRVAAQNRNITGTVTAKEDGLPLPGVSVLVQGTAVGTVTGADGKYSITASDNDILKFTFIGFLQQETAVKGKTIINAVLVSSSQQLGEVVVTGALGLTRTRNQQSYAAQQISGEEVSKARNPNFMSELSGKVSGLEVRQSSSLGGSTNVVLRGAKSISGNNQALFVVDGVPFSNGGLNSSSINSSDQRTGRGGYDFGSPAADINPDDIESVTVLKGAAASALYGSQGANGVILITTKRAKNGLGITVNAGLSISGIDRSTFPKYQKQYGGGYGAYYEDATGRFYYRDPNNGFAPVASTNTNGRLVDPTSEDASYGAAFNPNLMVYQWDAFTPSSANYLKQTPWVAASHDLSSFFTNPISNNQSIFITNGNDKGTFKLGYTRDDQNGIMPNSNILKNSINFGSTYNITDKLSAGANIDYTNTVGLGRYGTGYQSDNILNSFRQWYQVNNDIQELKQQYFASGNKNATWNFADPTDLTPIYWDNPYFIRYQNYESDTRNRYFGNVFANYKVNSWINVLGRVTVDSWAQLQEERRAVGSVGVSSYTKRNLNFNETNYDLIANANKDVGDFNIKGVLGANIRKQRYMTTSQSTNGGLVVPGIYAISNSLNTPIAPVETDASREVDGIYAEGTVTWKKLLNADATIRRDVSSTLPAGKNEYYYPSIAGGFIFSELLKDYKWLTYGKLRANYAEVGSDANPYSLTNTYTLATAYNSTPQAYYTTTQNTPTLKPERTRSTEGGIELAFFGSRLGLDASYYSTKTIDQLIAVPVSTSTGYSYKYQNSGTVQNKGVEITLNGTPVVTKDFSWKLNVNWTRNRNKLIATYQDASGNQADNLVLASFQGGVSINATLNQPLGTIRGSDFVYTNGQKTVGADGHYLISDNSNQVIGNYNPDWIGGLTNTFQYKNFTLSFLIDVRKGGSVFSLDRYYGLATGLYEETAGLNDLGNPSRNSIANGGGIILSGVKADGSVNTTRISNSNYGTYGYVYNPDKAFIYDASYVKLRQALITYSLPTNVVNKLGPVKGVDLSLIGRNLWIIHKNLPYADPEETLSSGNLQGYQSGAIPTTRTISFNAKFRF